MFNFKNTGFWIFAIIIFCGIIITVIKIRSASADYSQKNEAAICKEEDSLHFEGIIIDYSGYGYKSRPIMLLINDSLVSIPRYNVEMALYVGDTIKKLAGSHTYYIRRSINHRNIEGKPRDTISFSCQ